MISPVTALGRLRQNLSSIVRTKLAYLVIVALCVQPLGILAIPFSPPLPTIPFAAPSLQLTPEPATQPVAVSLTTGAIVQHAPRLQGRVEGSVQMLTGESVWLHNNSVVTGELLVPGTPAVRLNGKPDFGGVITGTGKANPQNYRVTLNGNATLGKLRNRVDPISLPTVAAPPAPTGTRDVVLNSKTPKPGDFATLRDLSLLGDVGNISVPPGTYGDFAVHGSNSLTLGIVGATQPAVYHLTSLRLYGGKSELKIVGPVHLTLDRGANIHGLAGNEANPQWLTLKIASNCRQCDKDDNDEDQEDGKCGLTIHTGSTLFGLVSAPAGTVIINNEACLIGTVASHRLIVRPKGLLRIINTVINQAPVVNAGSDQTITLPTNTVMLNGSAKDDGLPANSTLSYAWSKVSGPGTVTFKTATAAQTTVSFSLPGSYVLRLMASDGTASGSDEVVVNVLQPAPTNAAPVVFAGADSSVTGTQTILNGKVTDDGLPQGGKLTLMWSKVSGPGIVTFANVSTAQTTATFSVGGTYVLRLTANDGAISSSDDVQVTVTATPTNTAPVVDAGADVTVTGTQAATLNGKATDDGLPQSGKLTINWSKVSGPGDVTFANPNAAQTTATFSAGGTYVLQLTANDSLLAASDTVTVIVNRTVASASKTYTVTADFNEGQLSNVDTRVADQLQLIGNATPPPPSTALNPKLKWKKDTFTVRPESNQVIMAPAVIDLNGDKIPEVIFSTYIGITYEVDSNLRAINGADGKELWTVNDPAYRVKGASQIAVGDIDNDGRPEIIALHESSAVMAFEHDGTFKWKGPLIPISTGVGPSIADLDQDGKPEIIMGNTVVNNDGSLRWQGSLGSGNNGFGGLSIVVDLDLDGKLEVLAGKTAYRADGSVYFDNSSLTDGFTAVGNFDTDSTPEIVLVTFGRVYLLEHDGKVKWGPITIPGGGRGGAPTIADFDGDGQPEIGIAGASRYVVLETDGSIKWQAVVQDISSNATGSSVFDFNGDGKAEVIYGDEVFLRIYNGADGAELYKLAKGSGTGYELPVIVDVDNDSHAEIVAVANRSIGGQENGIYVIGGADNNWADTRRIWNQHSYHITNVNEDGTIPRQEKPNWLQPGLNNFRLNTFAPGDSTPTGSNTGSWSVVYDSKISQADWGQMTWNAAVCGDGALTVTAASSDDGNSFGAAQNVSRNAALTVANGRYLKITVTFKRASTGESPVLYDLSVGTEGATLPTNPANAAPTVNAGADQTITLPNSIKLAGTVCDDGLPTTGTRSLFWTRVSGPGTVTFSSSEALNATASFSAAGTYVLRLSASDGEKTASDEVTVVVK